MRLQPICSLIELTPQQPKSDSLVAMNVIA